MATPLKPRRDTPEGSPSRSLAPENNPPEPDHEPSQLFIEDVPSDPKECSRCHNEISLCGFVRSAKDRSTKGFRPEEMKVCNKCAFDQHNARAAGEHKDRVPTSERMQKQLSEEEYSELYGAEAIIKRIPAGGKNNNKDDGDSDEVEYVPPEL
ncbi:hypothetical protein J7T55_005956 [Diaporthe amygdali]|uniref:uncharacterized protein n=1 Tax=Phomopsis amygdali TaxID=1214568 RepID=UPI0022FF37DC|nr:uncharacterized protein J7T55_005956 [Diaporthe amygdali]KAJ0124617.1 hypothetical protein J7T55_005956 [Diaporthe amygdali]